MTRQELVKEFCSWETDKIDTTYISTMQDDLPESDRAKAEQILLHQPFKDLIESVTPAKHLVTWGTSAPGAMTFKNKITPLSVLCTNIQQTLSKNAKMKLIPLSFFCGLHTHSSASTNDWTKLVLPVGGRALIISLLAQLVRQFDFGDNGFWIDEQCRAPSSQFLHTDKLNRLLVSFIRCLPNSVHLLVMVDEVRLFEKDELKGDALPVLNTLIDIAEDQSLEASVKVLLTSTLPPLYVGSRFDANLTTKVESVYQYSPATSMDRVKWALEHALYDYQTNQKKRAALAEENDVEMGEEL